MKNDKFVTSQASYEKANKYALEFEFDIEKFSIVLKKYFTEQWEEYIDDIATLLENINIGMGFFYCNLPDYTRQTYCRYLSADKINIIKVLKINKCQDDLIPSFTAKMKDDLKDCFGVSDENAVMCEDSFRANTISARGVIPIEFMDMYKVVWVVYLKSEDNKVINQLLCEVVLNFLHNEIENWDELMDITEGMSDKMNAETEEYKKWFINEYRSLVFEKYNIPDEQIVKRISKAQYENRVNKGSMVFIKKCDFIKIPNRIEFNECMHLCINEGDGAERKLFESCISGYHMAVETDDSKMCRIIGFVKDSEDIRSRYNLIWFEGEGRYLITIAGHEVLMCERDVYYICKKQKRKIIKRLSEKEDISALEVIYECEKQIKYGALVIFFAEAEEAKGEVDRLCREFERGYIINAINLKDSKDFISCMAAVDGAIIADYEGICYAYGVILDGKAKLKGNRKRGARFNSAMNYIFGKKRTAVIISEDSDKPIAVINGLSLADNPKIVLEYN